MDPKHIEAGTIFRRKGPLGWMRILRCRDLPDGEVEISYEIGRQDPVGQRFVSDGHPKERKVKCASRQYFADFYGVGLNRVGG